MVEFPSSMMMMVLRLSSRRRSALVVFVSGVAIPTKLYAFLSLLPLSDLDPKHDVPQVTFGNHIAVAASMWNGSKTNVAGVASMWNDKTAGNVAEAASLCWNWTTSSTTNGSTSMQHDRRLERSCCCCWWCLSHGRRRRQRRSVVGRGLVLLGGHHDHATGVHLPRDECKVLFSSCWRWLRNSWCKCYISSVIAAFCYSSSTTSPHIQSFLFGPLHA